MTTDTIANIPPSVFLKEPYDSCLQKTEAEVIARNIMVIRKRNGDQWPLTWEKYEEEREKDGGYSYAEKGYFEQVMPLIPDAIGAIAFCSDWADAARKYMAKQRAAK